MNIFYLSNDPTDAAVAMVDSHVVKMILESFQLLSTAHRILDGEEVIVQGKRKKKTWVLPDFRHPELYQATHVNHPSAVWCRETSGNYQWLLDHTKALLSEYTYRYSKTHASSRLIPLVEQLPNNISNGSMTTPPMAMPDEYKIGSVVDSYREYYKKGKSHLHAWKNRQPPKWITS